jgi:hypothetical protein
MTRTSGDRSQGFSLIEALIAMAILTTSVLTLAAVFTMGLAHMSGSSNNLIAREKAREAIESVHTARDTRVITWAQIRNVAGGTGGGIFLDGPQALRNPGADGLVNTVDDTGVEEIVSPGIDGVLGTADDLRTPLTGFTREIEIRDLSGSLRQIRVIIEYPVGGATRRQYVLTTYISSYS